MPALQGEVVDAVPPDAVPVDALLNPANTGTFDAQGNSILEPIVSTGVSTNSAAPALNWAALLLIGGAVLLLTMAKYDHYRGIAHAHGDE